MSLNCILLGAPGAGKGTQAQKLAPVWKVPHISTGAMLRAAVQTRTPLGKHVERTIASGGLVGDDVMLEVVAGRLRQRDARGGFILDGFPRTIPQARALDWLLAGRDPLVVVNIVVSGADIVQRLSKRRHCRSCGSDGTNAESATCAGCGGDFGVRGDDAPDVVLRRLEAYHRDTEPLVRYYRQRGVVVPIDGAQAADAVTAAILRGAVYPRPVAV